MNVLQFPLVCTLRAKRAGVNVGPCGQPATVNLSGVCARGHRSQRTVCVGHRDAFAASPSAVICEYCDAHGVESAMTITPIPNGENTWH